MENIAINSTLVTIEHMLLLIVTYYYSMENIAINSNKTSKRTCYKFTYSTGLYHHNPF